MKKTIVMKFGGISLSTPSKIKKVAKIIKRKKLQNDLNIIVVVSAMGKMTDRLIDLSKKISKSPNFREQDMLISVGERISISLLAMALLNEEVDAISLTGSQSGIITTNDHFNAKVIDVRAERIKKYFDENKVVVVAGFQGVSKKKEITTLGRGGSDTSAIALGIAFDAVCVEFYKDVCGIYSKDPKIHKGVKKFDFLTYKKTIKILLSGSKVLHRRSVSLAEKNKILIKVLTYKKTKKNNGTTIGLDPRDNYVKLNENKIYEI